MTDISLDINVWSKSYVLVHIECMHAVIALPPLGGGGGFSKVVATFNHVGGSFNLFMATTWDV